jgi:hypothetical protein
MEGVRLIVSRESRVFIGIKEVQRGLELETEVRPCEVYRLPVSSLLDRLHFDSFSSYLKFSSLDKTARIKSDLFQPKSLNCRPAAGSNFGFPNKAFLGRDFHQKGRQSTTHAQRH